MPPQLEVVADGLDAVTDVVGKAGVPTRTFTWTEIARHNKRDDCYIVVRGKVYAVHDFIKKHPGGDVLLTYAGEDATDVFAAFHSSSAYKLLPEYCVGTVSDMKPPSDFVQECRRLRTLFKEQGLLQSSKLYYSFKIASNLTILGASLALALTYEHPAVIALAGALLALFWQQCGWLAHDFLHHQVFENRAINNFVGFIVGNWWQGFSVAWWKNKHNTHHAVPNVHRTDPDVDLMPLLAWSEHALDAFMDGDYAGLPKALIDYQVFTYPLLLLFARLSWAIQSVLWVVQHKTMPSRGMEALFLAMHWLSFGAVLSAMAPLNALIFFATSNAMCGLLLATVFSLNHNGMPIFTLEESKQMDYYTRQVVTGRDVEPTAFASWFSGGLNYQIEHHLFPMLPRHNFHKVQPLVKSMCKKYNIKYHSTDFFKGTVEVVQRLAQVAKASRAL